MNQIDPFDNQNDLDPFDDHPQPRSSNDPDPFDDPPFKTGRHKFPDTAAVEEPKSISAIENQSSTLSKGEHEYWGRVFSNDWETEDRASPSEPQGEWGFPPKETWNYPPMPAMKEAPKPLSPFQLRQAIKAKLILRADDGTKETPSTSISISEIKSWHAHIYFDIQQKQIADKIRRTAIDIPRAQNKFNHLLVGLFHTGPIGPHPKAQFEIHFTNNWFSEVVRWLVVNRQGLDVLIHPIFDPQVKTNSKQLTELVAHTEMAVWLGNKLKLDLNCLNGW